MILKMTLANKMGLSGFLTEISHLWSIIYDKIMFAETLFCNINPGRTS